MFRPQYHLQEHVTQNVTKPLLQCAYNYIIHFAKTVNTFTFTWPLFTTVTISLFSQSMIWYIKLFTPITIKLFTILVKMCFTCHQAFKNYFAPHIICVLHTYNFPAVLRQWFIIFPSRVT